MLRRYKEYMDYKRKNRISIFLNKYAFTNCFGRTVNIFSLWDFMTTKNNKEMLECRMQKIQKENERLNNILKEYINKA